MKKLEELLNIDLGRKFDTPKKLNRSNKQVPEQIVNDLEAGKMTSEMLQKLSGNFILFYYRSCVTVHGNWPDVAIERIGGYKNINQNKNGSLEIRWSAIDAEKTRSIADGLKGISSKFYFINNSTDRLFRWTEAVAKETFNEIRAKMQPVAERLAALPIYGYINLYSSPTLWGGVVLVLDVHLLAVLETDVYRTILALANMDSDKYDAVRESYLEQEKERTEKYQREATARKEAGEAKKKELEQLLNDVYKPQVVGLKQVKAFGNKTLVTIQYARLDDKIKFLFLKKDSGGSFGRIKVSRAIGDTLSLEGLQWKEMKQVKEEEFFKRTIFYELNV